MRNKVDQQRITWFNYPSTHPIPTPSSVIWKVSTWTPNPCRSPVTRCTVHSGGTPYALRPSCASAWLKGTSRPNKAVWRLHPARTLLPSRCAILICWKNCCLQMLLGSHEELPRGAVHPRQLAVSSTIVSTRSSVLPDVGRFNQNRLIYLTTPIFHCRESR